MLIVLDSRSSAAVHEQIQEQIIARIAEGSLMPGDYLPTAAILAETVEVNRNTVLQAYRQLRDLGYIELRRGRGAKVLTPPNHDAAMTNAASSNAASPNAASPNTAAADHRRPGDASSYDPMVPPPNYLDLLLHRLSDQLIQAAYQRGLSLDDLIALIQSKADLLVAAAPNTPAHNNAQEHGVAPEHNNAQEHINAQEHSPSRTEGKNINQTKKYARSRS